MLFVELVITLILTPVLPDINAVAMHDSLLELTFEETSIAPLEASLTAHLVESPHSCVLTAICPEVYSFSLLYSVLEITVIVAAVAPDLDSFTILTIVHRSVRLRIYRIKFLFNVLTLIMTEDTEICLPINLPVTLIHLAGHVLGPKDAKAARLSIEPVALERAAIWPQHLSIPTAYIFVIVGGVVALLSSVDLMLFLRRR